jgi:prophage antirepressor-like protein
LNIISKENILNFDFHSNKISVFVDKNGEIWFIAKQIADILGYSRTNKMVERLDDDEKKTIPLDILPIAKARGFCFNEKSLRI